MHWPGVIIRSARREDASAIADIHIESWQTAYRRILPDHELNANIPRKLRNAWASADWRDDDLVVVAEVQDGQSVPGLVGFIAVWCRPAPFIDNLHVRPAFSKRGIGKALLARAANELTARGYGSAHLWVFAANHAALRLYAQLGGVPTAEAEKDVFGISVPSIRFEWNDLSSLEQPPGGRLTESQR